MDDQEQEFDHQFKIVLLGDSSVGKSSILTRYTRDTFNVDNTSTQGVEYSAKILQVDGKNIKAQIWDTAGQEKFLAIAKVYYKGAVGALLVYDITSQTSFENIQKWYNELKSYSEKNYIVIMLVGNKCDMEDKRVVTKDQGVKWAETNKMGFMETSAKDGTNIEFTFQKLVEQIHFLMVKKSQISPSEAPQEKSKIDGSSSTILKNPAKTEKKKKKDGGCC